MARRDIDQGMGIPGPIRCRWQYKNDNPGGPGNGKQEFTDEIFRWHPRLRCDEFQEFGPSTTLPMNGWAARLTKSAGSPTAAILANTANGIFQGALDATSEVQYAGIDWADQLIIPGSKKPYFAARVAVSALAANQDVIIGFSTAYASPISGISKYARFHMSASLAVTVDATDGTNTTTAAAAVRGVQTLTAGTFYMFTIDAHDLGNVKFFIEDARVATVNLSAFADTDLLQPMIGVQKSTGAGVPTVKVDWARVMWNRI